jgi:N-acetylneuraminic acid mutarotase
MTLLKLTIFVTTILIFCICYFISDSIIQVSYSQLSQSHWSNGKNMSTPRSEVAASSINDTIFVIGGFDISGKALDVVEVYDTLNDTWSKTAHLPIPLHHTTASSYNGKVYVVGGFTSDAGDWIPTNKLFIYDPLKEEWKEGQPMQTARGALSATFVNGILYAIGGQQSSDIEISEILNTTEAYDPSTDTWTSKKAMPTSRHHAASSLVDGKIYVFGGRTVANSSLANLNNNEMYNPQKDEWMLLEPMPSKRSGIAAATYNDTIFVFGGEDAGGFNPKTYGNNENFNPATGLWTSKESLPTPRHGLSATTVNDQIFVIGGGPEAGLSVSNANEVYNPNEISAK